jgi:serine/threonine-protein kinase
VILNYGFFDRDWNTFRNFKNNFKVKTINEDRVIEDHSTNLMWHPAGSENDLFFEEAKPWVYEINQKGYAGLKDWRLPTLEEAASLLSGTLNKHNLYIGSEFSSVQKTIWTGDTSGQYQAWVVLFDNGVVERNNLVSRFFVRPVRTLI